MPMAPKIQVLSPPLGRALNSALRIELRFIPATGAYIDLESLQVLNGRLRFDITERILKHAKLSKDGLLADNAAVLPGNHRFLIRIADTLQRQAEQEISVSIQARNEK